MLDLHLDGSFYKQSMKVKNYFKIKEWHDSSIGQSTVIQQLDKKRPKLSNLNQTQNRRRYINFENASHFICSFNLNNLESTVCIAFRINGIASGSSIFLNGISGNSNDKNLAKLIAFYKTHNSLGLTVLTAYKFPSSKSNCTILNKSHVISVTFSNCRDLSNCWSNSEKLITFNTGNAKGSDHCLGPWHNVGQYILNRMNWRNYRFL